MFTQQIYRPTFSLSKHAGAIQKALQEDPEIPEEKEADSTWFLWLSQCWQNYIGE